jgi:hypothetical protein
MDALMTKAQMVAAIAAEHTAWQALLAAIGTERMEVPGAAEPDWTVKDVVAHLAAWRGLTCARLDAGRRHTEPAAPPWPADLEEDDAAGVDRINAWIYQTNRDRPLAAVLGESEAAWQEMADLVRATPEDDLLDTHGFTWLEGALLGPAVLNGSFEHLHEHMEVLQAWLATLHGAEGAPR